MEQGETLMAITAQNPYASFLGTRDAKTVIAETPAQLKSLSAQITNLESIPAPGKWSPREILCHLADCELVFAVRLRHTMAEPHHVIQPFDQDHWARPYPAFTAEQALAVFTAVRQWNLTLIQNASPELMAKPVSHPERGEMTFQTIVETMGGHDTNHLQQLEKMALGTAA
jgi:DinB superfamily